MLGYAPGEVKVGVQVAVCLLYQLRVGDGGDVGVSPVYLPLLPYLGQLLLDYALGEVKVVVQVKVKFKVKVKVFVVVLGTEVRFPENLVKIRQAGASK